VKRDTHRRIEAAAPAEAVVGSSASALPGSRIFEGLARAARCLVAHPANPPHLLPVVELVPGPATAPEAIASARALMEACGQVPVTLKREIEGFVMNRLQAGVVNEAMSLVAGGVIDPEELDAVMKHSLGLRWSFMGPFETMDLNAPSGFLDYARRYGETYRRLGEQLEVDEPWDEQAARAVESARRARVPAGSLAARQAWRDRRLMALAAHKRQMEQREKE
jgi:3-hydroxyacyl-CoA dehydrogenase